MNTKRNYSIDLLKFICMFGIIILHLTGRGGLLSPNVNNIITGNVYRVINNVFLVSVNIFCLITGYLYANKKSVNYKNIIDIIFTMLFYSLLITIIFYSFNFYNVRTLGKLELVYSLFPPMVGRYWFVTCYVFLFFMINYINKFISQLSQNQHKMLIFIIFLFFSVFEEIGVYDYFRISWGYSPFWLIFLFMVGSYMNKYGLNLTKKKSILLLIIFEIINISVVLLTKNFLNSKNIFYELCNNYNSPLMTINSILIFWIFININIKNNFFAKLGKYSLCVIILHAHRLIYDYVIYNNMLFVKKYNFLIELLLLFGISFLIYLICVVIEIIKKKIFVIFKIDKLEEIIGVFLNEKSDY